MNPDPQWAFSKWRPDVATEDVPKLCDNIKTSLTHEDHLTRIIGLAQQHLFIVPAELVHLKGFITIPAGIAPNFALHATVCGCYKLGNIPAQSSRQC